MAEFGWAYVVGSQVSGPSGSLQRAENQRLSGSQNLIYNEASGALNLTGSLNVSGSINANELNINVTNKSVINLSATGSTKFGDTADDTHIFTGSVSLTHSTAPLKIYGLQSGSGIAGDSILAIDSNNRIVLTSSAGGGGGIIDEYTNAGNNRIVTSIDSSGINAEANLLFDGSLLSVTGAISSSVGVSSSVGQYTQLTGANIQSTTITATTVNATNVGGTLTTAAQPNVTSVGTLTSLNVSGDLSSSAFFVSSSTGKLGIGTLQPAKKVEVLDTNEQLRLSYSKYIFGVSSDVYTDIYTTNAGNLILSSSNDRVGVGTATPTRTLDVDGDMRVSGNLEVSGTLSAHVTDFVVSANTITFGDSSTDTLTFNAATASVPNDLNIGSNLLMLDNGNSKIGIGVQNPDAKLEVLSTTDQLKLSYNQSTAASFIVTSAGNLDIDPTGTSITASSDLYVSGNTVLGANSTKSTTVKGPLTASVAISSSLGEFTTITASNGRIANFTDGTATITGGNISGVGTLTATNVAGTLTTAAQPNVTSVGTLTSLNVSGDLTVDTNVLKVNSTTNKVGIGRIDPVKKLDVLDTNPQLRLAYSKYILGVSDDIHSDIYTTSNGDLILSSSAQKVGIGTNSPTRMLDVNGHMRVSGNLEITGSLRANVSEFIVTADNITFGQDAEDTLIFNAASGTIINGLNLDGNTFVIDSNNDRIGIGLAAPDTKLHIQTTNPQLKLAYNGTHNAVFSVTPSGDLKILPTGNYITASSGFRVSGSTFLGSLSSQHTVVSGELTASVAVSSSVGRFTQLTASSITDGTATITGGNISGVGTLSATNVGGTLSTAAQPNVTSVGTLSSLNISGDLTVDTDVLKVNSTTNKVGIGRNDPQKKLEVLDTNSQLRLSYSKYIFGISSDIYSDVYTDSSGFLNLSGSGGKTKIDNNLQITGLSSGTGVTNKYLALDSSNNVVLTSSVGSGGGGGGGTETRGRRVITSNSTLISSDYYVGISASSNIVLTLLDASTISNGQTFTIKDEKGNGDTIQIRIMASGSQLIDGTGSVFIESPFGALNLYTDGVSKYFIF